MPVVINELEVVVEPEAPQAPPAAPPGPPPAGLTPADIADVVRHLGDRHERVKAD